MRKPVFRVSNQVLHTASGDCFGFRKNSECTIYEVKTEAFISFTVTAQLICAFVFADAKSRLSHDTAKINSHK